jgi:hypothetical protein
MGQRIAHHSVMTDLGMAGGMKDLYKRLQGGQ